MNAEEKHARLYEIVREVPQEAWPVIGIAGMLYWCDKPKTKDEYPHFALSDHDYHDDTLVYPEVAETLFVGSMTAWLAEPLTVVETWRTSTGFTVVSRDVGHLAPAIWASHGPTLLEALAAACKALAEGGRE